MKCDASQHMNIGITKGKQKQKQKLINQYLFKREKEKSQTHNNTTHFKKVDAELFQWYTTNTELLVRMHIIFRIYI